MIAGNSGRLKPSSMRRRASWTTRSVVTSAADCPASNSAPELLPRAAATGTAASTTSVDVGARLPQARSAISARAASIDQSIGSMSPNGASAASSAAGRAPEVVLAKVFISLDSGDSYCHLAFRQIVCLNCLKASRRDSIISWLI
jgi:hypothetical protein